MIWDGSNRNLAGKNRPSQEQSEWSCTRDFICEKFKWSQSERVKMANGCSFPWWIVFSHIPYGYRRSFRSFCCERMFVTQKGNFMVQWLQKLSLVLYLYSRLAINWRECLRWNELKNQEWSLGFSGAFCAWVSTSLASHPRDILRHFEMDDLNRALRWSVENHQKINR